MNHHFLTMYNSKLEMAGQQRRRIHFLASWTTRYEKKSTKTAIINSFVRFPADSAHSLLVLPIGCGKTLTAEAISELLEKPLYIVTAGDLGITASEVEKALGSVLELCQTCKSSVLKR